MANRPGCRPRRCIGGRRFGNGRSGRQHLAELCRCVLSAAVLVLGRRAHRPADPAGRHGRRAPADVHARGGQRSRRVLGPGPASTSRSGTDVRSCAPVPGVPLPHAQVLGPSAPRGGQDCNRETVPMRDITVSVDEATHRLARIRAAELDTSVSALVRGYLGRLVSGRSADTAASRPDDETQMERRRRRLDEAIDAITADGSELRVADNLSREELYDRARARAEAQASDERDHPG